MIFSRRLVWGTLFIPLLIGSGCASTPPQAGDMSSVESTVVDAPFDETWQATKGALRADDYLIYTRDKRGVFVAYSEMKRRLLTPYRTQFTVTLDPVTANSTRVTIESSNQKYGVSLLTYPSWRDQGPANPEQALAILDALKSRATGTADGEERESIEAEES